MTLTEDEIAVLQILEEHCQKYGADRFVEIDHDRVTRLCAAQLVAHAPGVGEALSALTPLGLACLTAIDTARMLNGARRNTYKRRSK